MTESGDGWYLNSRRRMEGVFPKSPKSGSGHAVFMRFSIRIFPGRVSDSGSTGESLPLKALGGVTPPMPIYGIQCLPLHPNNTYISPLSTASRLGSFPIPVLYPIEWRTELTISSKNNNSRQLTDLAEQSHLRRLRAQQFDMQSVCILFSIKFF